MHTNGLSYMLAQSNTFLHRGRGLILHAEFISLVNYYNDNV